MRLADSGERNPAALFAVLALIAITSISEACQPEAEATVELPPFPVLAETLTINFRANPEDTGAVDLNPRAPTRGRFPVFIREQFDCGFILKNAPA
jgi:hypothetical protein